VLEPTDGADGVIGIRHLKSIGEDDRSVRRAHEAGELVRVRRGAYTNATSWDGRAAGERYDLRIAAVLATRRSDVVLSHHSAARVWGLALIDPWPAVVHITESPASRRRSKNGVVVHRHALAPTQIEHVAGMAVTSLPRTLVDIARAGSFRDAVAAIDFARAQHLPGCAPVDLLGQIEGQEVRARQRIRRAVEFSSALSMSPLESLSRVVLSELGFPAPLLQHEFATSSGRRLVDFWWDAERVAGECDGRVKYADARYLKGRSPSEAVWEEKLRENELADIGVRLARWTWLDCMDPQRLAARLRAAGLRQSSAAPRLPRLPRLPSR
jgi:hypothetical protein